MKMKTKALLIGAFAVIGSGVLFATGVGKRAYNSVLDQPQTPVFKTAYTGATTSTTEGAVPIDFEKAAAAAVPSVVHIKVTMKAKEVAGRQGQGEDPFGGGMDGDLFRRFFGEGGGRAM